jgi:hypothetical protein
VSDNETIKEPGMLFDRRMVRRGCSELMRISSTTKIVAARSVAANTTDLLPKKSGIY